MTPRIVLFICSLIYFIFPHTNWLDLVALNSYSIPMESVGRMGMVFLILGVSLSSVRDKILPKFLHPLVSMISYIPDSILSHVEGSSKSTCSTSQHFLLNVVQVSIMLFVTKIVIKLLFIKGVSLVLTILFKTTMYTYYLVLRMANFGIDYPLAILVLLPIIKRVSWYYLLIYFSICGASCVALGLGIASSLMLVWRHLVVEDLFSSSYRNRNRPQKALVRL